MSKNRTRTIALSAVVLLAAAALVTVVRMRRVTEFSAEHSPAVVQGPYRLIPSESRASVKMFGQKAGWIAIEFPVDAAMVAGTVERIQVTTALRWSQAQVDPAAYQATFLEVFRPGHTMENRFEFLLKDIEVPAPGTATDVSMAAQVMLYGRQISRQIESSVSHVNHRIHVRTRTMATMNLTDFQAGKLASLLAVQSGATVSPLMELRYELVFEPTISTQAP